MSIKKQVLIAYQSMTIGGSTTSLLGLLDTLDYSEIEVDLQLYNNIGPYIGFIPEEVRLLPEAKRFSDNKMLGLLQRMKYPSYWKSLFRALRFQRKHPGTKVVAQITAYSRAETSKKNDKDYDVAIGFMEMWSDCYVYQKIKAKKKIAWIHVDYQEAGLVADVDRAMLGNFDKIVLVSQDCLNSFVKLFPELSNKAVCVENILSEENVLHRAELQNVHLKKEYNINFGTVCRIDFQKGLDRAVCAFSKLKKLGYKFTWHIIGNGEDFEQLAELIRKNDLEDRVFLYGSSDNPLPYVKEFDAFLLPSRYEGKPMAVTEAQMLGVPPVVTNYASAQKQIESGVDGLVVDNSEDGIFEGIKYVITHMDDLKKWKRNLKRKNFRNDDAINQIKAMIID